MLKTYPLKRDPDIIKIAGYDTETAGNDNHFILGSIYYETEEGLRFYQTRSREDFERFLLSDILAGYNIYATNNEFDFFVVFGQDARDYIFPYFSKSRMVLIKVMPPDQEQRKFLGTENYFPASVETLGKCIGSPKIKHPDFLGKVPKDAKEWTIMEEYNRQDSYITYKFMQELRDQLLLINTELKNTIASCALYCYRRNFQKMPTYQPSLSILDQQVKAYYGGRTEVFKRGRLKGRTYYYYDVNSLYPSVMLNDYPMTDTLKRIDNAPLSYISDYLGVSLCSVATPTRQSSINTIERYPLLPYRTEDKKLIFPLGSWKGWYCHAELKKAIELGYTIKPIKTYYYTERYKPFTEYVRFMYKKRLDNPDNSIVYKLLLNSLYGKWAMRWGESYAYKPFSQITELPDTFCYESSGWAVYKEYSDPARFVNPIFSIYTTSYARLVLYDLLVKYEGIYCDTDSIITARKIPTGQGLGELKCEYVIKDAVIVKPKLYFLEDSENKQVFKSKGLRIKDKVSFDMLLTNKQGMNMRFRKFKASLRRGLKTNAIYNHNMLIDLEDDKRRWAKPFNENELQNSFPHVIGDK